MCLFNNSIDVRFLQPLVAILQEVPWGQPGNIDKGGNFLYLNFRPIETNSDNPPAFLKRGKRVASSSGGTQDFVAQHFDGVACLASQSELGDTPSECLTCPGKSGPG